MQEQDVQLLAEVITRDIAPLPPADLPAIRERPPVRIVHCVMSLNRRYSVFHPRVQEFSAAQTAIQSCDDLLATMERVGTANFLSTMLRTNDPTRAETLLGVTRFAIAVRDRQQGGTEAERLTNWAAVARPGDYVEVGVKGFGPAGFQYLRMLFGADTVKPDVHIINFVSQALNRRVDGIQSVFLLERASQRLGLSARGIDGRIWERSARR